MPLPSGISASAAAAMSRELSWWGQQQAASEGAALAAATSETETAAEPTEDAPSSGGADEARGLAGVSTGVSMGDGSSSGSGSTMDDVGRAMGAQWRKRFQVYSVAREEVMLAWGIRATFAHRCGAPSGIRLLG